VQVHSPRSMVTDAAAAAIGQRSLAIHRHQDCPSCLGERGCYAAVDSISRGAGGEVWSPCELCATHSTWEIRTVRHEGRWWALACPEVSGVPELGDAVLGWAKGEELARAWDLVEQWPLDRFDLEDRRVLQVMELPL